MQHHAGGDHASSRRHRRLMKQNPGNRRERETGASQSMPDRDESARRCRRSNATDNNHWRDWAR